MTPPSKIRSPQSGPEAVRDQDGNGSLDSKDQVDVKDRRNPSQTKSIDVEYFVSVEYKDPAGRSPMARLGAVIQKAKDSGFGPKGRFRLSHDLFHHTLEHEVQWLRNLADKR